MSQAGPALEGRDLECLRGDRLLFSGLSFSLAPGTALQVRGANGTGKTSLLRIVCGLSLPEHGTVRWGGDDIRRARGRYHAGLAFIGHAHGIKNELTALENLHVARQCALTARLTPQAALDQAGLAQVAHLRCQDLSAGQRRRVALARLLVTGARLWILDEPLTAVDQAGIESAQALFMAHLSNRGLLLFTSHQPVDLGGLPLENLQLDGMLT